MSNTQSLVRQYFAVKAAQLRDTAALTVCEHSGLTGSHREELQRIYLRDVLPRRYGVGRGMIYSWIGTRSRECDIVIWDTHNYPSLPLLDHSFFFAETVKLVVECKSVFSTTELDDVRAKCGIIRDLPLVHEPSLAESIQMLQQDIYALQQGIEHHGALISFPHIASAGIFLQGGATLNAATITSDDLNSRIDRDWPDVMLLLEPGRVFIKNYETFENENPTLDIYDLAENSLLLFTNALLDLLAERSLQTESPLQLIRYGDLSQDFQPTSRLPFKYLDFPAQRIPLWD